MQSDQSSLGSTGNPVEELINKIQDNHSLLTLNESDKFRTIFDTFHKYKKLSLNDLTWLKEVEEKIKT